MGPVLSERTGRLLYGTRVSGDKEGLGEVEWWKDFFGGEMLNPKP